MLVVANPQDLKQHVGRGLAPSDRVTVDQQMIDAFAHATGDDQWIHIDVERAKRELPGKTTIAHGFLTLSLLSRMICQVYAVSNQSRSINYGANKVRFTNVVPAGSRIRLRQRFKAVEDIAEDGVRIVSKCIIEIEGEERPALVAEIISLACA